MRIRRPIRRLPKRSEAEQAVDSFEQEASRLTSVVRGTESALRDLTSARKVLAVLTRDPAFRALLCSRSLDSAPEALATDAGPSPRGTTSKHIPPPRDMTKKAEALLDRMTPDRRAEAEALVRLSGNPTLAFARALLAATPRAGLAEPERAPPLGGMSTGTARRMRVALAGIAERVEDARPAYADATIGALLARAYLRRLLGDASIADYLRRVRPRAHAAIVRLSGATT